MIPIEGEKYNVKIDSVSSDGNGVGRIGSFTVFVPMGVIGDRVEVKINKVKSRYAIGEIVKILEQSPDRIDPPCKYYDRCGGCQIQNMDYKAQVKAKAEIIENAVRRIGGIRDFSLDEFIECDKPFHYRNKVIFFCDNGVGMYERGTHNIVGLNGCMLAYEGVEDIVGAVLDYAKECGVPYYSAKTHTGILRRIFVRNNSRGEFMVVLSVNADTVPNADTLFNNLSKLNVKSVYLNIDKRKNSGAMSYENKLVYGDRYLSEEIFGIRFKISPESFFQINYEQTKKLYQKAIELADIGKDDTVMDLYCGIGTISLAVAKQAKSVVGVEAVKRAIDDARENAKENGIENAEFFADKAENIVPKLIDEGSAPDIVIMDPPRSGSDEVTISAILRAKPKRVVYVSCNPSTLARDLKQFINNGYTISTAIGVDMFPQTMHVETVVGLVKVDN